MAVSQQHFSTKKQYSHDVFFLIAGFGRRLCLDLINFCDRGDRHGLRKVVELCERGISKNYSGNFKTCPEKYVTFSLARKIAKTVLLRL